LAAPSGAVSADRQARPTVNPLSPKPEPKEVFMNPERHDRPPPAAAATDQELDPLAEAAALRLALAEVARRLGRLLASLRPLSARRRALHAAWTSLKQMRLGPPEER
jgi:hypothetical protein